MLKTVNNNLIRYPVGFFENICRLLLENAPKSTAKVENVEILLTFDIFSDFLYEIKNFGSIKAPDEISSSSAQLLERNLQFYGRKISQ